MASLLLSVISFTTVLAASWRREVVAKHNPTLNYPRDHSSALPLLTVGNTRVSFSLDSTGLQTLYPYATLSTWAWHNSSLPADQTPADYRGVEWWTHGRLVRYDQPTTWQDEISQWLIRNPHRVNLGRIGFHNLSEIVSGRQELDLWTGSVRSEFVTADGGKWNVWTGMDPDTDTLAVEIRKKGGKEGRGVEVFVDFPYASGANKFEAPGVGYWDAVGNHSTSLWTKRGERFGFIRHDIDSTRYFANILWEGNAIMGGRIPGTHRYILSGRSTRLNFTVTFSTEDDRKLPVPGVKERVAKWWENYWESGAFVSLPNHELERRIVLSQYHMALNAGGQDPPQESGLVNNGWYGKFHLEMYPWHVLHWLLWGRQDWFDRSKGVYKRFFQTSKDRAKIQGYKGVRWGKMSDPSGRSAPGEINSLLIWQQPHPMLLAELEYRLAPDGERKGVLRWWDELIAETAEFMADYAWWNETTKAYDLGPPMYPVSENTPPNATINPTFELAYWKFGLNVAVEWRRRQEQDVPEKWNHVARNLARLPIENGSYVLYEGVPGMWIDPKTLTDHPALIGIFGVLPDTGVDKKVLARTAENVWNKWNFTDCWGWDFPMLSMSAVRVGKIDRAVDFLLHEKFSFDETGLPEGGERVPTPYFPGSGGLLWAVGLMTAGWEGNEGIKWPKYWKVRAEGFRPML